MARKFTLYIRDKIGDLVARESLDITTVITRITALLVKHEEFAITVIPLADGGELVAANPAIPDAAGAIAVLRDILDHTTDVADMDVDELRESLAKIRGVGVEYLTKTSPIDETALISMRQVLQAARLRISGGHKDALYKAALVDLCQDLAGLSDNSRNIVQDVLGIEPVRIVHNVKS